MTKTLFNNQKKVNYNQSRSFTVRELQEIKNKLGNVSAQGLIDFIITNILNERKICQL